VAFDGAPELELPTGYVVSAAIVSTAVSTCIYFGLFIGTLPLELHMATPLICRPHIQTKFRTHIKQAKYSLMTENTQLIPT
jgi:hypothetical protein